MIILQASHNYQTQTVGNIFSSSEDLWNIIQSNIENWTYHIQKLLVDELDNCKGKGNKYAEEHIKEIQDVYKQDNQEIEKSTINNREQVQEKEVFLYKLIDVIPLKPKTSESTFI